jgi:DNA-directed RNA polymerase subunit H
MDFIYSTIYKNILKMCKLREYKIISPEITDSSKFTNELMNIYIKIECKDKNNKDVIIFILHPSSEYFQKTPKFIKLFSVNKSSKEPYELIFIIDDELRNNIRKKCLDEEKNNPNLKTYVYNYREQFCVFALDHVMTPSHRILSEDEKNILKDTIMTSLNRLPNIKETDPCAILIGAKHGDVIELKEYSKTAGERICYRYCI